MVAPFLIAFIVTALATAAAIPLIKRLGLVDDPKKHIHPGIIHKKIIPRGGGLPLFVGTWIAVLFFVPLTPQVGIIFVAALLALVIGLIDDRLNAKSKDVSPYVRFGINILTAVIVVFSGINIPFITNPFGEGVLNFPSPWAEILAVVWLIWVMNMINWSKGVDGQMPGIVAISALVIGFLSLQFTNGANPTIDATLSFIIAGSALGFLVFNFYPAKIFPGYSATSLYLLLGVVAMLSSTKLATAILVMGVPTVDAAFTIIRRLAHKRSPFKHDNRHLHHLLLKLGLSQRKIALFYWILSAILGMVALQLENKSKIFAIIMVITITGGSLLFLHAVVKKANDKTTP